MYKNLFPYEEAKLLDVFLSMIVMVTS